MVRVLPGPHILPYFCKCGIFIGACAKPSNSEISSPNGCTRQNTCTDPTPSDTHLTKCPNLQNPRLCHIFKHLANKSNSSNATINSRLCPQASILSSPTLRKIHRLRINAEFGFYKGKDGVYNIIPLSSLAKNVC